MPEVQQRGRCVGLHSVFYANNSSSVGKELPLAAADLLDMITVVFAGKKKPKVGELGRLLGARKTMIYDTIQYMQSNDLIVGFPIARRLPFNRENLNTFPAGGIPKELAEAILDPGDELGSRAQVSSSYTRDRDEEICSETEDEETESECEMTDDRLDGKACILDKYAVVDSAEDTTTASRNLPSAMRKLGAELDPEAASRRGLPPDTPNVLVVPHGNILDDFNNNSAWVEGFMHAFPEGSGGPLCPTRTRAVSWNRWIQILLKRRDNVWRTDRFFLFVAAAIKFRHEAMANVRFKLTVNDSMSADIASITEAHLESMASELQSGSTTNSALNVNPKIRTLLNSDNAGSIRRRHLDGSWQTSR